MSPDEVLFIQKAVDADGMHVSLRVPQVRTTRAPSSVHPVLKHAQWICEKLKSSSKQAHKCSTVGMLHRSCCSGS